MCGITGFCDFKRQLNVEHVNAATDVLIHRGPNSGGTVFLESSDANVGLGHRRLSILDVSHNGAQPMYSDDKNVVIVFNGEIYNFKEIRKELEAYGHSFHSDSDTEVIIKAYQQYGINAVHKFIGMFAFAIFDLKERALYLLRDRAGVKPLYYYYNTNCILFASELKSIYKYPVFVKSINSAGVSLFFKYGYIRAPHTIFMNTYKVRPGHYLRIDLSSEKVDEIKYYDVFNYYNKPKLKVSEEEAANEVERLFISAFKYRMVSDVPVGVFLSGGYDSAVVTSVLQRNHSQRVKTFTIGFNEEKFNEAPYAKQIAEYLGTDHYEYYCTTKEAQDILPNLADIYDEPFGDSSSIPTTLVSQFARKHVTVSLSADGGDEIFAGYERYSYLHKVSSFINRSPRALLSAGKTLSKLSLKYLPQLENNSKFMRASELLNDFSDKNIGDLFSQHYRAPELKELLNGSRCKIGLYDDLAKIEEGNDFVNTCLALDYSSYMVDDILVKVDRATMSVGLEGREPLLDNRIVEFVAQLPSDLKYNKGEKKYLLKQIAHKYIPKSLLDRPKSGFAFPISDWLRTDLKDYLYEYINEEQLLKHSLLDSKKAIEIRDEFVSGKDTRAMQVWLLLMFQLWWNRWM